MIVKIFDSRKEKGKKVIGFLKCSVADLQKVPLPSGREAIVVGSGFIKKVKKELNLVWEPKFHGWKAIQPSEIQEIVKSYERKANYFFNQANRLKTIADL